MKYLYLSILALIIPLYVNAQDTLNVSTVEKAIEMAEKGHYISIGLLGDSSTTFPHNFFKIPQDKLLALIVDNCAYEEFPTELANYQNLLYFRYSWFLFKDPPKMPFPSFLTKLKNIKALTIERLYLAEIPDEIQNLQSLESLELYYCKLPEFPMVVLELKNLTRLNLSCNTFEKIPQTIDKLKNLERLAFDGGACGATPITFIPESIGNLEKLTFFSLGYAENGVKELPKSFFKLKKLKYLGCNGCGLESLPEELGNLTQLEDISFSNLPRFHKLPESLFTLPNLQTFRFYQYGEKADEALLAQKPKLDEWGKKLKSYEFDIREE